MLKVAAGKQSRWCRQAQALSCQTIMMCCAVVQSSLWIVLYRP